MVKPLDRHSGGQRPIESMRKYYVYIMTNFTNTTLYIGITNNLIRRVYEHKKKLVEGFTKKYNLVKLVYYEVLDDPQTAIAREKTLKNLLRKKKNRLIETVNPEWKDLYNSII